MTTTPASHPAAVVPERLFEDPAHEARWRARFLAARMSAPRWADDAPDANIYVSNANGVFEVYAWDRASEEHRQVTDRPNGTTRSTISPDGKWIWWFDDTDGDEFGSWVREPFAGGGSAVPAVPALSDIPKAYFAGLALGREAVAIGTSTDAGTELFFHTNGKTTKFYAKDVDANVDALSRDESLLAIGHAEHGDARHQAIRILSTSDFETVAEKWDGKGKNLTALDFSPVSGDNRLLVLHERRGKEEILIWDIEADTETEISLGLPGEVVADWYPNANALLVLHFHQGRSSLFRYDLSKQQLSSLETPPGYITAAGVRPDGKIEYSWSSAAHPAVIRTRNEDGTDSVLLAPPGEIAPPSAPTSDAFIDSAAGKIHALVSRPLDAEDGPLPTVFNVHGGPHSADEDRFSAYRALWLEAGFAVVEVNYRGSTGYGSAWRDAIEGRPGLTELEDFAAVQDWAIETGLADPARCVISGASWGGYLALLALGTQPKRWAAGVANVPVADYVAAYEDEMEQLRAFDRALFGGSPDTVPAVYQECSPITYVETVTAPVLVLAGDNDPRCPFRQIENYLNRLADRSASYEFYRYNAGHGSAVIAETMKQSMVEVYFALRALGLR